MTRNKLAFLFLIIGQILILTGTWFLSYRLESIAVVAGAFLLLDSFLLWMPS